MTAPECPRDGLAWAIALDAELASESRRIEQIARFWRLRPEGKIGEGRSSGINAARSVLARHLAAERKRREASR